MWLFVDRSPRFVFKREDELSDTGLGLNTVYYNVVVSCFGRFLLW